LLKSLADYTLPIEPVLAELREYGWDAEAPLFTLTRQHVLAILSRYLAGQLTAEQVTDWADLVECREDFGYEQVFEEGLKRAVFELANPNLTEAVTPGVAHALRKRLS
jgi:hypothetical protein